MSEAAKRAADAGGGDHGGAPGRGSVMQMLWFIVLSALTVVPLFKILPGYRLSPWWSLSALIPVGLIVLLWVMAARADDLRVPR